MSYYLYQARYRNCVNSEYFSMSRLKVSRHETPAHFSNLWLHFGQVHTHFFSLLLKPVPQISPVHSFNSRCLYLIYFKDRVLLSHTGSVSFSEHCSRWWMPVHASHLTFAFLKYKSAHTSRGHYRFRCTTGKNSSGALYIF